MSPQPTLPGFFEWRMCVRCGQVPKVAIWNELEPGEAPGMNVSCGCCTISGEINGMLETWNREASNTIPSAYRT